MSTIDIAANSGDATLLSNLARVTFPLACPPQVSTTEALDFCRTALTANHFRSWMTAPDADILVATRSDSPNSPAGYCLVLYGPVDDPDIAACVDTKTHAQLSKMYVHPNHHRSGIATQLVSHAVELVTARNYAGMWLGVNQENTKAQSFYRAQRFTLVGTRQFTVGSTQCDDYVLARKFSDT